MSEHLTDIEIHQWSKEGPGANGPRLVEHLAECAQCTQKYAAAVRTQPMNHATEAGNVNDFVEAGGNVAKPAQQNFRWIGLAAAAILVIIVAVPLIRRGSEPDHPEIVLRGGNIQALSPSGLVQTHTFDFVWSSGVTAAGYRVEIGQAQRVIAFVDTKAPRLAAPPNLAPGDYWWQVSALNEAHQPLATSARSAFSLRPR